MGPAEPLSVVAVSPVAEAGGAEVLLMDILTGLQARGVAVSLVALGDGPLHDLARSRGIAVLSGPPLSFRRPLSVLTSVRTVRRAVRRSVPAVVHASHPKGQLVSRLGCLGLPVAQSTQLYDPPSAPTPSESVTRRLRGLRFVISAETAEAYSGILRAPVELIPPGIDLGRLVDSARRGNPAAAWDRAGLESAGGSRIVMVARLQRFKGPLDFVDVAATVVERHPAQFLIVGPDSPQEPALREEIGERIRDRGLSSVVALAGRLSSDDLAATVEAADLLLHPTRRETFGLAVLEALALGTPAIAYDSPGPRAILAGGGGRVVPPGDVSGLSSAVLEALGDRELLERWRDEARAGTARFDIGVVVDRYVEVFERLASARSKVWPPGLNGA